jgi:hypothetical protein
MIEFEPCGPFEVLFEKNSKGVKHIKDKKQSELWEESECGERVGVYIFGIRTGGGITPWYVGRTVKGFSQECFQHHKLNKYNEALHSVDIGTPVIFFICEPIKKGRNNMSFIDAVETLVINYAQKKNPEITNVHKRSKEEWVIKGITQPQRGKSSKIIKDLKNVLGI